MRVTDRNTLFSTCLIIVVYYFSSSLSSGQATPPSLTPILSPTASYVGSTDLFSITVPHFTLVQSLSNDTPTITFSVRLPALWAPNTWITWNSPPNTESSTPTRVKHVLGFEGVKRNASGELSVQDDAVRFLLDGSPAAQISISSIQNISLGEEDKQVGGVPMMLGKTAVPYGGGRVISLFSHKKYDSLTIEYLDSRGGFHGAIFQLAKGQGQTFKKDLIARGAHLTASEGPVSGQSTEEQSLKATQQWSVQVDRIDPGATDLDPLFSDATYENLLQELARSKQFEHVFRSGDRNANDVSGVLVLKTLVEKYSPGSETRRAVTTVAGATKLNVHIQLLTRNGRVVVERAVKGNVRFIGDNLRATNKVANNAAKILKQSTLPTASLAQQATGKESTSRP